MAMCFPMGIEMTSVLISEQFSVSEARRKPRALRNKQYPRQGLKKGMSGHLGQEDFPAGQVTFHSHNHCLLTPFKMILFIGT